MEQAQSYEIRVKCTPNNRVEHAPSYGKARILVFEFAGYLIFAILTFFCLSSFFAVISNFLPVCVGGAGFFPGTPHMKIQMVVRANIPRKIPKSEPWSAAPP